MQLIEGFRGQLAPAVFDEYKVIQSFLYLKCVGFGNPCPEDCQYQVRVFVERNDRIVVQLHVRADLHYKAVLHLGKVVAAIEFMVARHDICLWEVVGRPIPKRIALV